MLLWGFNGIQVTKNLILQNFADFSNFSQKSKEYAIVIFFG